MKINSNKENLLEGIQIIQSSLSGRTTLPILHNFLAETDNGKLKLVKTDLEMATTHFINADIAEPGSVTIPLKEFSDILQNMPSGQEITINTDGSNKVHIKCKNSKFWVMGTPKEEYPLVPDMDKSELIELPAQVIQKLIHKTIFAASTQETRYVLNGLSWGFLKKGIEVVATDGRRLAVASYEPVKSAREFKIVIPSKILYEVTRFIGIEKPEAGELMTIGVSSNQVGFRMGGTTFISKLIDGNFPNYEQVIPAKKDVSFTVSCKELLETTKRAALCVSERGGVVKYALKNGVIMISAASQKMEMNDEVPVDYKGHEMQISFNPAYIVDILKNMPSEKAVFSLTNPLNPVLVEPAGDTSCKYVVMPVKS